MNKIIINADDYGYNDTVTDGIYEAFMQDLITDTTILANGYSFKRAVQYIHNNKEFAKRIGVHLNLTQGSPISENIKKNKKFVTDNRFNGFFLNKRRCILLLSKRDKEDIYEELSAQIEKILNEGIEITHVDSHHHMHIKPNVLKIIISVCKKYGITKIRIHKNMQSTTKMKNLYYKILNYYIRKNGFISTNYFCALKHYHPIENSMIEIMVHPELNDSNVIIDRDRTEFIDGVRLISGRDLRIAELEAIRCCEKKTSYYLI